MRYVIYVGLFICCAVSGCAHESHQKLQVKYEQGTMKAFVSAYNEEQSNKLLKSDDCDIKYPERVTLDIPAGLRGNAYWERQRMPVFVESAQVCKVK